MPDEPIIVEVSNIRSGKPIYLSIHPVLWVAFDFHSGFPVMYFEHDELGGNWVGISDMQSIIPALNDEMCRIVLDIDPLIFERECTHVMPPREKFQDPFDRDHINARCSIE